MVNLEDIMDLDQLNAEYEAGYVRTQVHPEYEELVIMNYTEKAQFERHWNDITRMSRGLIYNSDTGEVLARPFPKLHNFDEPEAPPIVHNQVLYAASNKFDGSLGIYYIRPDGIPAIATRGSFASDQAIKGTKMLHENFALMSECRDMLVDQGVTSLFEIIYPENRIVLPYDFEALVPLGFIGIADGYYTPHYTQHNPVPRTMGDVLMDLSRPNAEGWVVWASARKGVKIKQADYVELHRVVTGLNRKSVWRKVQEGPDAFVEWQSLLPDELYQWASGIKQELEWEYASRVRQLDADYVSVLESLDDLKQERETTRKDLADVIAAKVPQQDRGYMFLLADGRDIQDKVWRELEPVGNDK